MLTYTIRRLLIAIPTLLFISLVIFLILEMAPGDPLADQPLTVPPEVREKMRAALGLDQPAWVRYLLWLKQFFWTEPLHLVDSLFGTAFADPTGRIVSWQFRAPAMDIIWQRLPQTLWVVGLAYVVGVVIAVPIGIISAYRQYSWFDNLGTFVSMVGFSVPTFFTGVVLIIVFAVNLHWFPSIYDTTLKVTDWESFLKQARQMVMPVTVLALFNASQISRFMRASMLDNLQQDYVRTARAKGMPPFRVIGIHALRNAMIPVVTTIGLQIGVLMAGAILTETIFSWPGIGKWMIDSISRRDYPVVQSGLLLIAALVMVVNLIVDLTYGLINPRIRVK